MAALAIAKYLPQLLCFLILFNETMAKRKYRLRATNVECTHSIPEYIEQYRCRLYEQNNRSYGSANLYLKKEVKALNARVLLDIFDKRGRLNLFDMRVDGCAVLRSTKNLKIFDTLLKAMRETVNQIPQCPMQAHFNYTVSNFTVLEDNLPAYIPVGSFHTALYILHGKEQVLKLAVDGYSYHIDVVEPKKPAVKTRNKTKKI